MTKLNLGAGDKIFPGYINVDFRYLPGVDVVCDLSVFPWQWQDESVEEIKMFDFLEHFSWRKTDTILNEVWRVLQKDGTVIIQVPDFEQCAKAIIGEPPYYCNECEKIVLKKVLSENGSGKCCPNCGKLQLSIAIDAIKRLSGGQDYKGNTHLTNFSKELIELYLSSAGFGNFEYLEEENEYMARNWSIKIKATKIDPWEG